jgi:hypothetical protein
MLQFLRRFAAPAATSLPGSSPCSLGRRPTLPVSFPRVGQFVQGGTSVGPPREEVVADTQNHGKRVEAYESFGDAVIQTWQWIGFLLIFKPRLVGYVHGLVALVRAKRRVEEQSGNLTSALHGVLLFGSHETQEVAISVVDLLAQRLTAMGRSGKQGSEKVRHAYASASVDVGDRFVAWRKAAQADLGLGS